GGRGDRRRREQREVRPVSGRLASKVVVVTGGGTGIGRAVAARAVADGAAVVIAGRRRDAGERAAAELRGSGGRWRLHREQRVDRRVRGVARLSRYVSGQTRVGGPSPAAGAGGGGRGGPGDRPGTRHAPAPPCPRRQCAP